MQPITNTRQKMTDSTVQFLEIFTQSWQNNTFVKMTFSNYKGEETTLKNLYAKKILLKDQPKLSFTYRYQTNDIVKNYGFEEGLEIIKKYSGFQHFRIHYLFTTELDMHLEYFSAHKVLLKQKPPSLQKTPTLSHDKKKKRAISPEGKAYLHALKITDEAGKVYKNAQDKYRQINHYLELLRPLMAELPGRETTKIYDMGAGKGYLTFALYDYLSEVLKMSVEVTGIEYREDLVGLCNQIAQKSGFEHLSFGQGTIEHFPIEEAHILIALHACDTATDEAIYRGISLGADLIVVAPCCHKQIRRELEKHTVSNELDFLVQYGIFLERQAEMLTDGLRALILEYFGYKTKVMEFISDAHTPKNVMLIGAKKLSISEEEKAVILEKIKQSKAYFGVGYHHLERLLEI